MTNRQRTTDPRLVKGKGGPTSTSGRQSQERPHSRTTQSSDQAKSGGKWSLKDDPRNSRCPVPGCNWYSRHMKHHAWECHIPQIFWDNPLTEIEALPAYHQLRASVLGTVASWIVGNVSTIHDLVRYVNQTLAVPSQCPIMDRTRTQMGDLTRIMGWWAPRVNNYNLQPLNSPAVLIHWPVLLALVCQMTWDQKRKFCKMGGETVKRLEREVRSKDVAAEESVTGPLIPAGYESADGFDGEVVISGIVRSEDEGSCHGQFEDAEEGNTSIVWAIVDECGADNDEQASEPASRRVVLTEDGPFKAFDAHFHLDRYSIRRHGDIDLSIGELVEERLRTPIETHVQLVGGVLVYCDVDSYPTTFREDTRWKVSVGIHPRNSPFVTNEEFQEFTDLLARPEASAFGKVGVDWTEPRSIWKEQDKMLRRVLALAHPDRPIVLHIRGRSSDKTGQEVYLHVLDLVREKCTPDLKVQLHCFSRH